MAAFTATAMVKLLVSSTTVLTVPKMRLAWWLAAANASS
jgi:hypothetical protein